MLLFFGDSTAKVYAVETSLSLTSENKYKLQWLFDDVPQIKMSKIAGNFVGPRANMIGFGVIAHRFSVIEGNQNVQARLVSVIMIRLIQVKSRHDAYNGSP